MRSLREAEAERLRLQAREKQNWNARKRNWQPKARKNSKPKSEKWKRSWKACCAISSITRAKAVNAVQDRAAAQKLSKDAERRIAKLRREFREQFDSTVVAHTTGADQGRSRTPQPQVVKHVSEGDTVKLKSMGRVRASSRARIDDNHFEVEIGVDEDEDRPRRHRRSHLRGPPIHR